MQPNGTSESERLGHVRPAVWRNPLPEPRYGLVVVGAGPAGLVAAHGAAALGVKVALVERNLLGGDCLNTGCVPSKTLIRTSRLYAGMREAPHFGVPSPDGIRVDFPEAMRRLRDIRARMSGADSVQRLVEAGVHVFFGQGSFTSHDTLAVGGVTLRFNRAIIATGARPDSPSIPGLAEAGFLTNENVFALTELPRRLLVIGGGPLGCELAQAFSRLGSRTTIVQDWPLFLPREERDAAQILSTAFAREGIEVRLNTQVERVQVEGGEKRVDLVSDDFRSTVVVDAILTGTGRLPQLAGLDLEAAGVESDPVAGVKVNDFLRTTNRRIYAAGDVCAEYKFTHVADETARIAVRNALFLGRKRASSLIVPWCTYTDPEIAHVGLYVRQARERGIPVRTFTIPMNDVDRAIMDGEEAGFVKIHLLDGTDRILGATIVARHAGEMINEITLAMEARIGLSKLAHVIHPYPTQAGAIRMAADAYERTRLTAPVRSLLRRWLSVVTRVEAI